MATSPLAGNTDLVSVAIMTGGDRMPDTYRLYQVKVNKAINRIPSAKITLIDGDPPSATFPVSEGSHFTPGTEIEIKAGYHDSETTIFKGIVVKHAIRVRGGDKSYLVLSCYDKAIKMTQGRKSAYAGKSDSDIIEGLIGGAGLSADVEATTAVHEGIVRYYATDWDFIVCRAEVNGQVVIADDGKVSVKAPQLDGSAELLIGYGDALQEINLEIDARVQMPSVTCKSWDYTAQQLASGASSEPSADMPGNLSGKTLSDVLAVADYTLQSAAPVTADELKVWANARLLKSRLARVRGSVSFRGNASPKPGTMVELAGLGARFNGDAYISSVTQTIEEGEWITELGLGLSPQWFVEETPDVEAPPASGLLPAMQGLQIGKVKQIDQDPDGQTRVLVDLPLIGLDGDGIWARMATGYATKKAGIFFMPEIDDEVVLGFLNDDPSFPVILGSLYSSQRTPPYQPDAPNTTKAIVTNAQIKISMDDVKKKLQIETPGGHIITLNDDDQSVTIVDSNKNKMNFSSAGIKLDSPADISIKATGSVSVEAGTGITIKAGTDLNMQALNVNAKASVALAAQGQASAELSASGQVTVRGAMVMIN